MSVAWMCSAWTFPKLAGWRKEGLDCLRSYCISLYRPRSVRLTVSTPYIRRSYTRKLSVNHPGIWYSSATSTITCRLLQRRSLPFITSPRTLNFVQLLPVRSLTSGFQSPPNTRNTVQYIVATVIVVLGLSYAAVPLYRLFCQASGYGGTVTKVDPGDRVERMEPDRARTIVVRFNADISAGMRWQFKPQQKEITVVPGETALAFYTARNSTDKPVTGISTYNVVPFEAGQYFNKIQCFCFEEQILNPNEQVDMPVFFYIDPEFSEDPAMARVTTITLSYTFFEAKEGDSIYFPLSPSYHKQ